MPPVDGPSGCLFLRTDTVSAFGAKKVSSDVSKRSAERISPSAHLDFTLSANFSCCDLFLTMCESGESAAEKVEKSGALD